jgi:hypothetical protein
MTPLHVPTVGIVVAAMVTGSLLTAVGITLTDRDPVAATTVPTVGITEGTAPEVYDAGEGTPREAWAACVQHALTTPGMGGDADMHACDDAYVARTGDTTTLWLWCPGAPEAGGCRAEDGPYPGTEPTDG